MTPLTDGSTIYNRDGNKLGTVHVSQRSRRWFYKLGRDLSPARFYDAVEAADALKKAAGVRV